LILTIVSYAQQGTPWFGILWLLGATAGVPMGLSYPFPLLVKLEMVIGLLISLLAMIYGFRNHQKWIGQVLAVMGILAWSLIGFMGLGTGT